MTHDELLAKVDTLEARYTDYPTYLALRAVVELHKPEQINPTYLVCTNCYDEESGPSDYPCDTIQAIEEAVQL
jgi:hypothetical protein